MTLFGLLGAVIVGFVIGAIAGASFTGHAVNELLKWRSQDKRLLGERYKIIDTKAEGV
jgi:hypothetical protein